tara:strand:- start:553 stop:819 length:267 start_codon:yes stop_codon:yes gene_type:complete
MKTILFLAFAATACLEPMPEYVAAPDPEPEVCSGEDYPLEAPPESCESDSYGTCCMWLIDSSDAGTCRYDYCTYHEDNCEWTLVRREC